jgi:hypothetical protein
LHFGRASVFGVNLEAVDQTRLSIPGQGHPLISSLLTTFPFLSASRIPCAPEFDKS